jgi:hypothetical protein
MTMKMDWKILFLDYYLPILRSKWFYLAIGATVLSYVAMSETLAGIIRDYLQFGPTMAELRLPLLGFFVQTCRYSIPIAELGILGWEMGKPVETFEAKFPDALPAGTQWGFIWLQFLDEENVMIHAGQFKRMASYADMGFADTRGNGLKPNEQWKFLLLLARKGGEIKHTDPQAKSSYKKQKQLLSDKLKQYFRLDFDPFDSYVSEKAYKIKMTLMPPPEKPKPPTAKADFQDFAADLREEYEEQMGRR